MKRATGLLAILICLPALAQTALTITGPATAKPGDQIMLRINLTGSAQIAALQWTNPTAPAALGLGPVSAGVGVQAAAAGKTTIQCSTQAVMGKICMVYGMNQTAIAAGEVAVLTGTISGTATAGAYTFNIAGLVAVAPIGSSVAIVPGGTYTLTVTSRFDLTGDGKVDIADVQQAASQGVGDVACGTGDVNKDGRCDLLDVIMIILAALGL